MRLLEGVREHSLGMAEVLLLSRNIENEGAESRGDVPRQLVGHAWVASNQVGTEGLGVAEGPQPVRSAFAVGPQVRELPVPDLIRNLHRHHVRDLSCSISGE